MGILELLGTLRKHKKRGSSPFVRTTIYNQQTPLNTHFQPFWETFEKLNQTEKLLKKLHLYNQKYLLLRNCMYYANSNSKCNT